MADDTSHDKDLTAVALEYDIDEDVAPRITASGHGRIAEQIIAIAEAQGITIHKDADLVQILAVLEVDSIIPMEAYSAVAEILSYIYKKNSPQKLL